MQLRRLAALERKLKDEYKEVTRQIKELETLLARPDLMRGRVRTSCWRSKRVTATRAHTDCHRRSGQSVDGV